VPACSFGIPSKGSYKVNLLVNSFLFGPSSAEEILPSLPLQNSPKRRGDVLMSNRTFIAPKTKPFVGSLKRPTVFSSQSYYRTCHELKQIVCWVIGHNWLSSRHDLHHSPGGTWGVIGAGCLLTAWSSNPPMATNCSSFPERSNSSLPERQILSFENSISRPKLTGSEWIAP
jgi:hypothetical protein